MSLSDTIAIAIMGSGGAGAITAGDLLLEAAGRAGWHGLMTRSGAPDDGNATRGSRFGDH